MKGLAGKVTMITGGANGIGRASARAFAGRGCRVVILDIDASGGRAAAEELSADGAAALFIEADVSNEPAVQGAMDAAVRAFGRLDILVNCAAAFRMRGIGATVADWERSLAVNVVGYALCVKHALPHMITTGGGAIVNVCSISAHIAQPNYLPYSATKGAIVAMTKCMALDLAPHRIRVNAVSPGTVWTESAARHLQETRGLDRAAADDAPDIGGRHILGRCADPAEIAEAIAFLASDSASFITATDLLVDGGYTAR